MSAGRNWANLPDKTSNADAADQLNVSERTVKAVGVGESAIQKAQRGGYSPNRFCLKNKQDRVNNGSVAGFVRVADVD